MILGRAVVLPVGLISTALLARALGPADLGVFAVATSIVALARQTISALFNRASIILIAETPDWEPVAVGLIQLQLLLGLVTGAIAFLAAPLLANALGQPLARPALQLLAVAVPVSTLAQAYRHALDGCRAFKRSALMPVISELSRLLLLVALVSAGLGLTGAALAGLGAACAELWLVRRALRLRLLQRVALPQRRFLRYSLPLALDTGARRLHKRIDLWAVQALAGATATGYYSAARSFEVAADVIAHALYPVILATVSDAWARGHRDVARGVIRQTLRLTLWLLPFAALGAGRAPALIALVFGDPYLPAAPMLAWLSFSAAALTMTSIVAVILAAVGRPGTAFAFNGPLLVLAVAGYLLLVPRMGGAGAAATTAVTTWAVAAAMMAAVYRWCEAGPGRGTVVRVLAATAVAYALARAWHVPGVWVIPQLLVLCGVVLLVLWALGEVTAYDLRWARSLFKRARVAGEP